MYANYAQIKFIKIKRSCFLKGLIDTGFFRERDKHAGINTRQSSYLYIYYLSH